jgi:hypothetical protein
MAAPRGGPDLPRPGGMFAGYVTRCDTIDQTSIGIDESVKTVKILEKITKIFLAGLAVLMIGIVGYVSVVKFREYQVRALLHQ